jgi:hypothetical protein
MLVGFPWPDIIIKQQVSPCPVTNITFVVKERQPLTVLKMLIVLTMHSISYGGKT